MCSVDIDRLTARELEVVGLVVDGLTDVEIADRLVLSHRTINGYVRTATRKTGTRTRTQLAVLAVTQGWVPVPDYCPCDAVYEP